MATTARPASPKHGSTPLLLGKYTLVQQLGTGGMAQVWLARKAMGEIEKAVALKVSSDFVGLDPKRRQGILNEVRVAGRMRHSNIVSVMDAGEFGGVVYIELELVDGQDLRQFVEALWQQGKQLPYSIVAYIVRSILEGLNYAHCDFMIDGASQRVVHRDLTPSNVIVSTSGEVKIIDFGIGKYYDEHTSEHHIKGKPRYMSPEHAAGDTSPAIDIFAVGAILYELVEGRRFRHDVPAQDLFLAAARGGTPRITRPDAPAIFVRLYELMVAPEVKARIHSAAAAIAMIDGWDGRPAQPSELRALVRMHTGRTRSGYTHGEFEVPAGLEAALAVANARAHGSGQAAPIEPEPRGAPTRAGTSVGLPGLRPPSLAAERHDSPAASAIVGDEAEHGPGCEPAPDARPSATVRLPIPTPDFVLLPLEQQEAAMAAGARAQQAAQAHRPQPTNAPAAMQAAARSPSHASQPPAPTPSPSSPRSHAASVRQAPSPAVQVEPEAMPASSRLRWLAFVAATVLPFSIGLVAVLWVAGALRGSTDAGASDEGVTSSGQREHSDPRGPAGNEAERGPRLDPVPSTLEVSAPGPKAAIGAAEPAATTAPSSPTPAAPAPAAADAAQGGPEVPAAGSTVPANSTVSAASSAKSGAEAPPSTRRTAKPSAPKPQVAVRIVPMFVAGELAIGRLIYPLGERAIQTTIPAGHHSMKWRASGVATWTSRPKLELDPARTYTLRVGSNGVEVASVRKEATP